MTSFFRSLSLHHGYLAAALSCAGLLAMAYYFEYVLYLDPCPLCMLQRLITLMIGIGFLLAFFTRNTGWPLKLSLLFTIGWGVFGIWAADHQLWLQNLPPEDVPACGPSFDYMLDTMPLAELLKVMLHGDGNCAEVSWTLLGKSMPWWTRIAFAVYGLAALFAPWRSSVKRVD
mgnify:FL=1